MLNRCFSEKVLRALVKQICGQRLFPTKGTAVQRPETHPMCLRAIKESRLECGKEVQSEDR